MKASGSWVSGAKAGASQWLKNIGTKSQNRQTLKNIGRELKAGNDENADQLLKQYKQTRDNMKTPQAAKQEAVRKYWVDKAAPIIQKYFSAGGDVETLISKVNEIAAANAGSAGQNGQSAAANTQNKAHQTQQQPQQQTQQPQAQSANKQNPQLTPEEKQGQAMTNAAIANSNEDEEFIKSSYDPYTNTRGQLKMLSSIR